MANIDNAYGLRPIRHKNGAPYNGSGSLYHHASSDTNELYPGDVLVVTGTSSPRGVSTITLAGAGTSEKITGVMLGITQGDGTISRDDPLHVPASTEKYVLVEDNPDVVFSAQYSGTLAVTDISNGANLSAGTGTQGKSGWEVGATSTQATAQVKILRMVRSPDNEMGAQARVEVQINTHTQSNNTAGV